MEGGHKLCILYEKHVATEVARWHRRRMEGLYGLNQWWEGQARFPMKQDVLTHGRVHLLLSKGHS
ncbi:rCG62517 [Rattus norvegicus]|uniref:RCG62517 n=1 Tax=Rattus norvegicus TaxID=10116 RepID=A6J5J9_RAT|nr:rCG62517 [Rattus norvegicus]